MRDRNIRNICGNVATRRFAYLNKKDHSEFGLLLASCYADARQHLGSRFYIRQTWLTLEEEEAVMWDKRRKRVIVHSVFMDQLRKPS